MTTANETQSIHEKIKAEYKKVDRKTDFIIELSKEVKRAKGTIRNHWFGGFWEIPLEYQDTVLKLLQNKVKIQGNES